MTKLVHYDFERLDEGVHAAIARRDGFGVSNSGVVDLGDGALVFDTGLTPISARDLKEGTVGALGRPASVAAISHWHLDHSLGNQEFATVPIWATHRTREILLEQRDALSKELAREQLEKDVRELERLRDRATSDEARTDLEMILGMNHALLASADELRWTPPDRTFETRLALPGTLGAELLSFGSGHTDADALLHLPKEGILFTGDVAVVGVQPSLGSGDPDHWLTVLDQVEDLHVERIVPGHGPVSPAERIGETREYLVAIRKAAEAPAGSELPGPLRRWEGSVSFEENLKFVRSRLARQPHR